MEATLEKQGDSLILPIPHEVELALGLNEGDTVNLFLKGSALVVARQKSLPETFEELWGDYPTAEIELDINGAVGSEERD